MKICFVTNLYGETARGGAERVVEEEARALAAEGHDVVVVSAGDKRAIPKGICLPDEPWLCPPPGGQEQAAAAYAATVRRQTVSGRPRTIVYYPPNIYRYADGARHGYAARLLWHLIDTSNLSSARTLEKILRYERPDIVHTHNLMGLGFLIPRRLKRGGLRHVHTVHDVQLLHPSGLLPAGGRTPFHRRLGRIAYAAVMKLVFGSPQVVIFPSKFLMDLHARHGFFRGSKLLVIRNPAPESAGRARIAPKPLTFLFVGQLEAHKGVDLLLDAWERRIDKSGAALEIAGTGSMEEIVRFRAERLNGVRLLGKLEAAALSDAYDRAAFVVVPSRVIENSPQVILESMSRGTPVIAAAAGGIPETVHDGENGYLFAAGEADACRAALDRAFASSDAWPSLSAGAAETARRFSLNAHLRELAAVYASVE